MADSRFRDWRPPSDEVETGADGELEVIFEEDQIERAVKGANGDEPVKPAKQEQQESEDDSYSERVKKRIARERRVTQRERERAEAAERELKEVRSRLEEIDSWRKGLDTEQRRREAQERKQEQDRLEADLATAIEEGDTQKTLQLNRQLIRLAAKEEAEKLIPAARQSERDGGNDGRQTRKPAQADQQPKLAREFLKANASWWEDPDHAEDREIIKAIDRAVFSEGIDPNTPEYYEEVIERAKRRGLAELIRIPEFLSGGDEPPQGAAAADAGSAGGTGSASDRTAAGNRGPSKPELGMGRPGASGGNGQRRSSNPNRVVLTQKDREAMRKFKLDPDNPKHQVYWAKGKQERLQREGAGR